LWLSRRGRVKIPAAEGGSMSSQMTVTFPGGKRVDASYDGFTIATDQAVDSGGDGSAPEPFDYFLSSIATCAGIYVLGFCQKREIPYEDLRIIQSWERDEKNRRITTIRIAIEVPPNFPDKYHKALIRAANQCSVKKTMEDPPQFVVETVANSQFSILNS
jgi:ribosomal protein S12 methylthiotransferase accessory factor